MHRLQHDRRGCRALTFLNWSILLIAFCQAAGPDTSPSPYDAALDEGSQGTYPTSSFLTTKLKAPKVNFRTYTPECSDGYYLLTPKGHKVKNPGPMILDSRGDPVWSQHFDNEFGGQAYDLQVKGGNLTFWLGDDRIRGHGDGHFHMLDSGYDVVNQFGAANGLSADLHEFLITPDSTGIVISFNIAQHEVQSVGRKFQDEWNQFIWDCVFQEIDLETGNVKFQWIASEHVNLTSTYRTLTDSRVASMGNGDAGTQQNPFDWFHMNSVDKDEHGNYLICARYTHAVYYISGRDGSVLWTLGGKDNRFKDLTSGHALNFAWQHDARFVSFNDFTNIYTRPNQTEGFTTKLMTIFDNAADDWDYTYGPPYSRGMLLEVTYPTPGSGKGKGKAILEENLGKTSVQLSSKDHEKMSRVDEEKVQKITGDDQAHTVRLIQSYVHPQQIRSSAQGSMSLIHHAHPTSSNKSDAHVLIGYGINPVVAEYSSNGTLLCDLRFGAKKGWETGDIQSYRAFKVPTSDWIGRPYFPPAIAAKANTVYVSWSGATEVREWLLQVSAEKRAVEDGRWTDVARVPKTGFETAIVLPTEWQGVRNLRVSALDKNGQLLKHGVSGVLQRGLLRHAARVGISDSGALYMSAGVMLVACASIMLFLTRVLRRHGRR
ncbi:Arylsulfotransferase (ASST) [Teratosphaeria destructans]|uniref:Arylsulfotransferase (ASST) n=1 Tax=Teratosphaeria destructans TaxID=418781 RepID=A0A9W7SIW0_9PEZI|nr:Arylsulfotransferase (ASST) [Teratosphaeria destructans]